MVVNLINESNLPTRLLHSLCLSAANQIGASLNDVVITIKTRPKSYKLFGQSWWGRAIVLKLPQFPNPQIDAAVFSWYFYYVLLHEWAHTLDFQHDCRMGYAKQYIKKHKNRQGPWKTRPWEYRANFLADVAMQKIIKGKTKKEVRIRKLIQEFGGTLGYSHSQRINYFDEKWRRIIENLCRE